MKNKEKPSEEWIEEIRRETEHYYQGEMQQEERASWLLAFSSVLIIFLLSPTFLEDKKISLMNFYIPITLFLISVIFSILALIPYKGTKAIWGIREFFCQEVYDKDEVSDFVSWRLHSGAHWSTQMLIKRTMYHFRSHYIRNYKKSRLVIVSAFTLLAGLIVYVVDFFKILS